jgi:5-methylcytosine-specific restriction protein A
MPTQDHQLLSILAKDLPLEPRARILPEERLEAALLTGDAAMVESLVRVEEPGIAQQRRAYLYTQAPVRNRRLVDTMHSMYHGKYPVCLWDPTAAYNEALCHGHHLQWLSRGGKDDLQNMILVCPNHHAAIHECDAAFDYGELAFVFGGFRERLRLNLHIAS